MIFTVSAWTGHHGTIVIDAEPCYPTGRTMYGVGFTLWMQRGKSRPIPTWGGQAIGLTTDRPVYR